MRRLRPRSKFRPNCPAYCARWAAYRAARSRFAGAAAELKTAILVNPLDPSGIGAAIHDALLMPIGERRERWEAMMEVRRANTIDDWSANFLKALKATRPQDGGAERSRDMPRPRRRSRVV